MTHHRAEHALAPVRGQDADGGHPGGRDEGLTGQSEFERVRGGGADGPPVRRQGEHAAVHFERRPPEPAALDRGFREAPERGMDCVDEDVKILIGRGTNLHCRRCLLEIPAPRLVVSGHSAALTPGQGKRITAGPAAASTATALWWTPTAVKVSVGVLRRARGHSAAGR